ncbi:MAG: hypothetical protein ACREVN_01180 [Gammaproteobacteria bacterium]
MMLGKTEFRDQVEFSVRPFRDVLLGLFFVASITIASQTLLLVGVPAIMDSQRGSVSY